jgi:hypothetical protein
MQSEEGRVQNGQANAETCGGIFFVRWRGGFNRFGSMKNRRLRSMGYAAAALAVVWLLVWAGYALAQHWKITAERVERFVAETDLARLSAAEREAALRRLADMINSLPPDERRQWRREGAWKRWFDQMTEDEKGQLIEATMPSGFKQMLDAFAAMPEEKRKKLVDNAIKNMKQAREEEAAGLPANRGNNDTQLSPELEQKVRAIGLKTYYTQSSAETKAELAPLLEEMQKEIRNGRGMR